VARLISRSPARPAPAAPPAVAAARSARSLRYLYFFRTGFSALWVTLVFWLASAGQTGVTVGFLGGTLLVAYPVSDAIAMIFEIRSGPGTAPAQRLNLALDVAAAAAVLAGLPSSLADAITAFGVWAILSGAVMIYVAVRRQRRLRGQWLMIISGAGSVFAGTTFVGWAGSSAAGLSVLADYSAGGAVWYLLTALWLSWTAGCARPAAVLRLDLDPASGLQHGGHEPQHTEHGAGRGVGHRAGQGVRRHGRAGRDRPGRPGRVGLRPARPERGGQARYWIVTFLAVCRL